MPHRSYASTANYRFGFNGKENDNEPKGLGNQQDYGMRVFDPRLGKFLSSDPLSKKYPWYTPYQFAGNTPIQALDLDGLEEYQYNLNYNKKNGTTSLQLVSVRNFNEHHLFFGLINFNTPISERAIVTFEGKKYYIGFAGSYGRGNEDKMELFKEFSKNPDATLFPNIFLNEDQSYSVEYFSMAVQVQTNTAMYGPLTSKAWFTPRENLSVSKSYGEISVKSNGVEVGTGGIGNKGMLELDINVKKGPGGVKIAEGRDVFNAIFSKAAESGNKINGIRGIWTSGDNLETFNNLITTKVNKGLMTLEEAALQTFTGKMAIEKGYNNVSSINGLRNADGTYRNATVNFSKK